MIFRSHSQSDMGFASRLLIFIAVLLLAGFSSQQASARPNFGDNCAACHDDVDALTPAAPEAPDISEDAPGVAVPKPSEPVPVEELESYLNQTQDQERQQTQTQLQKQDQLRKQRRVQLSGHAGDMSDGTGQGHGSGQYANNTDPWSYRLNFGVLHSSDIGQHRASSLFHGGLPTYSAGDGSGHGGGGGHGIGHHEDSDDDEAGTRVHLGTRATYAFDSNTPDRLSFDFALNYDYFIEEDLHRFVGRIGPVWRQRSEAGTLKVMPYLQRTVFDNQGDTDKTSFYALGLNLNKNFTLSTDSTLSVSLHGKQRRYDDEDDARRLDVRAGLQYSSVLESGQPYRVGFSLLNRGNPKQDYNRYFGQALTASTRAYASEFSSLGILGELGRRGYNSTDPATGVTREDTYLGFGFSYSDQRFKVMSATPKFSCMHTLTNSNVAQYDVDTTYCAMFLERRF